MVVEIATPTANDQTIADRLPMTGNEAIARGAWQAGVQVAAAYPGTPSTEIMEAIATYPRSDIEAQWSTNEKVALDVTIGASLAVVRSLCAMKHVGLNVAADAHGLVKPDGVVIVDSDLVSVLPEGVATAHRLPLTETARRLGSHRVTNVVSLGAIAGLRPICSDEALEAAVARYAPPKFRDLNLSALAEGRALTSVASHTA